MTAMSTNTVDATRQDNHDEIDIHPLTEKDQEVVWEMLKHAAHETTDVRNMKILIPYGDEFGKRHGDFGWMAYVKS